MKSLTVFLLLVLSSLTLTGCGKSGSETTSSSARIQIFEDLEQLTRALNKQKVYCNDSQNNCPGYSAKLTFWGAKDDGNYYLGVCSGSLYQNKYIITNSHCIPEELKRAGANCSDQIKILFPQTSLYSSQSSRCARVIQAFNNDQNQPDIAVLELEQSIYRDNLTISKNNFIDSSKVYAYTMNPSPYDSNVGNIVLKKCTLSIDNALFMANSNQSHAAVLYGNECNVIGGNSGSGLLNEKGELIGAIYAKVDLVKLTELFAEKGIMSSISSYMGIVQNIGCLNSITNNSGISCNMKIVDNNDFESFIARAKQSASLEQENDALINYEISDGFKLKLMKVNQYDSKRSLDSFRQKWGQSFIQKNSSLAQDSQIIQF